MMCALPDLVSLNFGASYGITDNFNVWIQADNLLNRTNWYGPSLPEPGIQLAAGIGVTF
jgi:outer membrane receptor protein involved in Fe transport